MKTIIVASLATIVLTLVLFNPLSANADQGTGSIILNVKYHSGDIAETRYMSMQVFQDTSPIPYINRTAVISLPYTITSLPLNHQYKVEVFEDNMHSGYGIVDLRNNQQNLDLTIPRNIQMSFFVYYNDGVTPINGATVTLKSNDGVVRAHSVTDVNGQVKNFIEPASTDPSDFYYAEVTLGSNLLFKYSPILAVTADREYDIKTDWPSVVSNTIVVQVYKTPQKLVDASDGNLGVEIRDYNNSKILSSSVDLRGEAHISNLKVGNYLLFVVKNPGNQTGAYKELASEKISLAGQENVLKIFINDPFNNGEYNCKCVAFRLDDVQDRFLNVVQMAVIKEFEDKNASLTIGIIGHSFGHDPKLVNYIKNMVSKSNPILEIASHSWSHPDMTNLDRDAQFQQINETSVELKQILGVLPKTFIPPYNHFNNDTLSVLKAYGITHLSSHTHFQEPTPFVNSQFYEFHAQTQTAAVEQAGTPQWKIVVADKVFQDIHNAVPVYGYAVVNMHPYEFSRLDFGKYTNTVNQTQLDQLGLIIDKVKAAGYKIVPIENIDSVVPSNLVSQAAPEVPEPTTQPTSPLTEKQNVMPGLIPGNSTQPNCNCVAFRLDVIQDHSIGNIELAIIKSFQQKDASLTVGVIGKLIGTNPKIVGQLKDMVNNNSPNIELANRGWENLDHTQYTMAIQSNSIKKTNDQIANLFGVTPTLFIPPYNKFDNDTLSALRENGIKYISSSTSLDPGPYNFRNDLPLHVPQTILLSKLLADDVFYSGTINDKALAKIKENLNKTGFSVVSINAKDFVTRNNLTSTDQVNVQKLQTLESLLDFLKSSKIKIVTIEQIPQEVSSQKSPSWVHVISDMFKQGQISFEDVLVAQNYLIQQGIIKFGN
jgi:peptidoglycan/xylan/chitin deacetylase (PgdA/CDA1 family)